MRMQSKNENGWVGKKVRNIPFLVNDWISLLVIIMLHLHFKLNGEDLTGSFRHLILVLFLNTHAFYIILQPSTSHASCQIISFLY